MNSQGEPAFPVPVVGMDQRGDQGFVGVFNIGLTKREWFVGMALHGILARSFGSEPSKGWFEKMAVYYADAALAELAE